MSFYYYRCPWPRRPTIKLLLSALALLTLTLSTLIFFACPEQTGLLLQPVSWDAVRKQDEYRIAKASISYEEADKNGMQALKSHARHNTVWGYPMHVLCSRMVRGGLNKALWLQQLIVQELQKGGGEGVEWILYIDPTISLQNAHIPLHILLPPIGELETYKALSILATKPDSENLSTAVFFIRSSGGSLRVLTEAMAYMYENPTLGIERQDVLARALQHVLEREQNREKAIFQPREWYNDTQAVFLQPYSRTPAERLLPLVPDTAAPSAQFPDPEIVHRFWRSVSEARRVLNEARERDQTVEQGEWRDVVREVRDWVELRAWETVEVDRRVAVLRERLGTE